jgi:hypothetical protein
VAEGRFPPPQRDLAREGPIAAAESMQTIRRPSTMYGKMHGVVPAMPKVACTRAFNVAKQPCAILSFEGPKVVDDHAQSYSDFAIAFVLATPCTALAGGKKDTIEVQSPSHQITQPTSGTALDMPVTKKIDKSSSTLMMQSSSPGGGGKTRSK